MIIKGFIKEVGLPREWSNKEGEKRLSVKLTLQIPYVSKDGQERYDELMGEMNIQSEEFLEGQKDFPRTILLKRQTELQEMLQKNIQFKQQSIDELKQTETLLMAPLRTRLNAAIATVAREQHLALVINTDGNACPFIESTMGVDVTEAVEQLLSK